MYSIYEKTSMENRGRYMFKNATSFFGIRSGLIPKLLRSRLSSSDGEPHAWHLPLSRLLDARSETFIIDLKPNNRDPISSRSLYELLDVWGYTNSGWTPVMLRMQGLTVDGEPIIEDPRDFVTTVMDENKTIYSFLYLAGGIQNGELVGKWTAPRASSTNSALLWPESLTYFVSQIGRTTPAALRFVAA